MKNSMIPETQPKPQFQKNCSMTAAGLAVDLAMQYAQPRREPPASREPAIRTVTELPMRNFLRIVFAR